MHGQLERRIYRYRSFTAGRRHQIPPPLDTLGGQIGRNPAVRQFTAELKTVLQHRPLPDRDLRPERLERQLYATGLEKSPRIGGWITDPDAATDLDRFTGTREWRLELKSVPPLHQIRRTTTQAKDEAHLALNEKILERGKFLAEYFAAHYHVLNAYTDSENFPDRQVIARMSGLPRENIHRDMGKPEDVIAATAEKYGADMVILGISPRTGLSAKFASHTTEKVMEKITVDVVALN